MGLDLFRKTMVGFLSVQYFFTGRKWTLILGILIVFDIGPEFHTVVICTSLPIVALGSRSQIKSSV